jgi:hypothetical protein
MSKTTKSIEQISDIVCNKIFMTILSELPNPDCPLKRQQNEWKKSEVKKAIIKRLSDDK